MPTLVIIFIVIIMLAWIFKSVNNFKLIESATKSHRGNGSERDLVLTLRKRNIHPDAIYHDLYFQKKNGSYTQIDLVLATPVGLIVFEVKDYSGWLYGNGKNTYWTQVLSYGKEKYRLYNPVLQNQRHIEELRKASAQFSQIPMFSVVVFYGNCELKKLNNIPNDTFVIKDYQINQTIQQILENNPKANYSNKLEVIQILSAAKSNGDNKTILTDHVNYVEDVKRNMGSRDGKIRSSWEFEILPSSFKKAIRFLRKLK
jgi:hypothetical protein